MAMEQARDGSLGELGGVCDLEARQPAAAQSQDAGHAQRVDGFGGTMRARTAVGQSTRALGTPAGEPFENGARGDTEGGGHLRHGPVKNEDAADDLGSTPGSEPGFTVQVHAALVLGWVLCDNPTFPNPRRMNNLLERHI